MTDDNQIHLGIESRPLTLVDLKASLQMPASLPASAAFFYTPFTLMLADVLLYKDRTPKTLATFEEGYQVQRILDASRQSADQGTRVSILL